MSEADFERRLEKIEKNIEELYNRSNDSAIGQAKINTALENILATLGRLEGVITALQTRPSKLWDIVVTALISGAVALLMSFVAK